MKKAMVKTGDGLSSRGAEHRRRGMPAGLFAAIVLAGVLAGALILAGCGGAATTTTTTAGETSTTTEEPTTTTTSNGTSTTTAEGTSTTAGGGGAEVVMQGFAFRPDTVTIAVGQSVTWTNQDGTQHDAVSDEGVFSSPLLSRGETFSFTFDTAGTYTYHCDPHPYMTGTIVVE